MFLQSVSENSAHHSLQLASRKSYTMGSPGIEKEDRNDNHVSEQSSRNEEAEQLSISENTLLWKIDLRILPILCVVYLMAFIDRYVLSRALLCGANHYMV
jgi:hypothetical protein